jgi:hypothetical protein
MLTTALCCQLGYLLDEPTIQPHSGGGTYEHTAFSVDDNHDFGAAETGSTNSYTTSSSMVLPPNQPSDLWSYPPSQYSFSQMSQLPAGPAHSDGNDQHVNSSSQSYAAAGNVVKPSPAFPTPTHSSMGPPPSRSSTKRSMQHAAPGASTNASVSSKRSSKNALPHPTQLEYYGGQWSGSDLTYGIFFSLIHRDVINETFPSFTNASFGTLYTEAQAIFAENNPKCKDRG